jgi:hypothetical protein
MSTLSAFRAHGRFAGAGALLVALALLSPAAPVSAATLDAPLIGSYAIPGHAKVVVIVFAGESGAPAGFTLEWMKHSDYLANGNQFLEDPSPLRAEADFTGVPTANTFDGDVTTFVLPPEGWAAVEVGDLFDETGISRTESFALAELELDTGYVFRAFARGDGENQRSEASNLYLINTRLNVNCTYTQGFWKNHPDSWPVSELMLGDVNYTKAELLAILNQPAQGNGLLILAHQLIAAELNAAQGADITDITQALADAHALIGSLVVPPSGGGYLAPNQASSLAQTLDDYNNGVIGPGHCGTVSVDETSWSRIKASHR